MGIFDKFKSGLSRSSKNLSSGFSDLIFKRQIDDNTLNELEDFLIQSDVGVQSAKELKDKFASIKVNPKIRAKDPGNIKITKQVKAKWSKPYQYQGNSFQSKNTIKSGKSLL